MVKKKSWFNTSNRKGEGNGFLEGLRSKDHTYVDLGHFIRGGAAIIAQNIEEKSLDIYSFQRLASDLINLLLEFQNVEATYCVLQHDDHWIIVTCAANGRNHPTSKVAESIKNLVRPMKFIGSPMAKKKSWFNILKRFFIRETNSKQETDRRRKRIFGGLKIKRLSLLTAPSSLNERNLDEAEEELIKHALAVAHATKAAAEAAVTTALVASEIVQFTSTPQYNHQCVNDVEEFSVIRVQGEASQSNYQCVREIHEFAVTRIQSAVRGLPFTPSFQCCSRD
ncbi:hypothetical protein CMV_007633 [Castanea mollissima]|uniref:Uncharacterized protein n=1 Tax=Castanea mollissima TaxID=60419 RepID=A0A8J4RIA3_9ROSI|nr:hypothetical protein CMV_007633 [Castanea mollissima]